MSYRLEQIGRDRRYVNLDGKMLKRWANKKRRQAWRLDPEAYLPKYKGYAA